MIYIRSLRFVLPLAFSNGTGRARRRPLHAAWPGAPVSTGPASDVRSSAHASSYRRSARKST